jgi:hypothetical protein
LPLVGGNKAAVGLKRGLDLYWRVQHRGGRPCAGYR